MKKETFTKPIIVIFKQTSGYFVLCWFYPTWAQVLLLLSLITRHNIEHSRKHIQFYLLFFSANPSKYFFNFWTLTKLPYITFTNDLGINHVRCFSFLKFKNSIMTNQRWLVKVILGNMNTFFLQRLCNNTN